MVGRDGGVGGFFEIRSMEAHCRAEGGGREEDYGPARAASLAWSSMGPSGAVLLTVCMLAIDTNGA